MQHLGIQCLVPLWWNWLIRCITHSGRWYVPVVTCRWCNMARYNISDVIEPMKSNVIDTGLEMW